MFRIALICLVLAASTFALYWQVTGYDFVNLDDPDNVVENALVANGLTPSGIVWALRTSHPDYWRPATWLSLMLDTEIHDNSLGDMDPFGYHLTNILLHTANVVLLFLALRSLTGTLWRSAFIAAAFAVHPIHVESVAWITERKDVLAGFFGILCLWTYGNYARRGGMMRYLLVGALLGIGLMAKPMLVPFPCLMLLLDIWPLKRVDVNQRFGLWRNRLMLLVVEKTPFFIMAAFSSFMTMRGGGAAVSEVPLAPRLANVVMSYAMYINKLFRPIDLAVYYPYRGMYGVAPWETWRIMGALALLIAMSIIAFAFLLRGRALHVFTGWFWFLGLLVPVIGLMQVGAQGMADRFMYFPAIGLYMLIAWCAVETIGRWKLGRIALVGAAALALATCGWLTTRQVQHWRDTVSLYDHALAVTQNNWKVHDYYGNFLVTRKKDIPGAIEQFKAYLALRPDDATTHVRLGVLRAQRGEDYEALLCFEEAVRVDPDHADAQANLAYMLLKRGELHRAMQHFERAATLNESKAEEYRRQIAEIRSRMP